jgi:PDZ domain-containing protein
MAQQKAAKRRTARSHHHFTLWSWSVFTFLCVIVLFLPTAFSIETPGPTLNVLGKSGKKDVIQITGVQTHRDTGKLLMTTVNINGIPGQPALVAETLWGWADPSAAVLPREVFFPPTQSGQQFDHEQQKEMTGAQSSAAGQAADFLRKKGYRISASDIHVTAGDIGGPSAGLMFTLGIIDKVTPQAETGGQVIAGTGTIGAHGKVGVIGGVTKKMLAARRDGAHWFFVPAGNCAEAVGHVPAGLRDIRVSSLSQAYHDVELIGRNQADRLPHCAVNSTVNTRK